MPPYANDPSRWRLSWTAQPPPEETIDPSIQRTFLNTPSGPIELLRAEPSGAVSTTKAPLLFLHGGFGRASEYASLLLHFRARGHASYAVSLRGHGRSWTPSFLRMCFFTTAHMLAADVACAVGAVRSSAGGRDPVLVAHSNGGGLAQMVLDRGLERVAGLVLLAGTPNFGAWPVYRSWLANDPWFLPRMYFRDWGHPRSPLSSTELVRRAFFSRACPEQVVRACERGLSEYEALMWPMAIMGRFVSAGKVLAGCAGKVLVVAADQDALMRVEDMRRMAAEYREAAAGSYGSRVGIEVVRDSGHSLHLDVNWNVAAGYLAKWLQEID